MGARGRHGLDGAPLCRLQRGQSNGRAIFASGGELELAYVYTQPSNLLIVENWTSGYYLLDALSGTCSGLVGDHSGGNRTLFERFGMLSTHPTSRDTIRFDIPPSPPPPVSFGFSMLGLSIAQV